MILMGNSMVSGEDFPVKTNPLIQLPHRKGLEGPWFRLPWRTSETRNGADLDSVPQLCEARNAGIATIIWVFRRYLGVLIALNG